MHLPQFRGVGRIQESARRILFPSLQSSVLSGLKMEIDPWEWVQNGIFKDGVVEPLSVRLYERILAPADTYVDVGAHVGFHALIARRCVGDEGRIVAIDPQPYNCEKILTNCRANDFSNILTIVAVAGGKSGFVTLNDQSSRDKSRLTMALTPVNDRPRQFRVPMIRLDGLFDDLGLRSVELLKIDVEGFEPEVLKGLGRHISMVRNMLFELLPDSLRSSDTTEMLNSIRTNGFELRTVEGKMWMPGDELPENNCWAARDERRARRCP